MQQFGFFIYEIKGQLVALAQLWSEWRSRGAEKALGSDARIILSNLLSLT